VGIVAGGKAPVAMQVWDTGDYDQSVILDPSWVGLGPPVEPLPPPVVPDDGVLRR
jgi:hypothetical protein